MLKLCLIRDFPLLKLQVFSLKVVLLSVNSAESDLHRTCKALKTHFSQVESFLIFTPTSDAILNRLRKPNFVKTLMLLIGQKYRITLNVVLDLGQK